MGYKTLLKAVGLVILSIIHVMASQAQQLWVGSSNVSIEPDSTIFSLALAGYGAPREGRFDIQWQGQQEMEGISQIASAGDLLYAVNSGGELLKAKTTQSPISWKKIAAAEDVISLTGGTGTLYAVTKQHDLMVFDLRKHKAWKKMGQAADVSAITLFKGHLFGVTSTNHLLMGTIGKAGVIWKPIAAANHFTSLANDGVRIYGVDANNSLWSMAPDRNLSWLKIGVNNGSTYTTDIRQVLVHRKRLFALGKDNLFLVAAHTTDRTLSVRSIAIKKNDRIAVIVTLDLTGFDYSLGNEIKDIIYKKRKIPKSAILINASHTHFAPVSQSFPAFGEHGQAPDSSWFNNILKKGIVRCIESALDNFTPETIWFGRGVTNIGHNRSSADNTSPNDTTLDVLKFARLNGKVNEILFSAGCHPVFRNEGREGVTISANYPGVTRNLLEGENGASNTFFLQGCGGDINPRSSDHRETGRELASNVLEVLGRDMQPLDGSIDYSMDTIFIPTTPWSKEKIIQFRDENLKEPGDVYAEKNVRWANMMLELYRHDAVPKTTPVYVQTITIGKWKLVGLSREVVTEYGPAIRDIWPGNYVTVAGYCNDVPGYLPTGRHIKDETYEGVESFFWNAQASLFPVDIFQKVIEGIRKIKNKQK